MALARLPSASTVLVGAVAAALVTADQSSWWASIVKKVLAVLLVLNWRALPFAWHSVSFRARVLPQRTDPDWFLLHA